MVMDKEMSKNITLSLGLRKQRQVVSPSKRKTKKREYKENYAQFALLHLPSLMITWRSIINLIIMRQSAKQRSLLMLSFLRTKKIFLVIPILIQVKIRQMKKRKTLLSDFI